MSLQPVFLGKGAEEIFIKSTKFNTSLISFNFYLPLDRERIAEYSLLPFMLSSCGKNYPDFSRLNYKLSKLFGADLFASSEKVGDYLLMKIGVSVINDKFALDNEKITAEAVNMLLDLIFNPKVVDGAFCNEDLEREKRKAIEHIKSEIAEKRIYAKRRLIEEMFSDELYGMPKCGTIKQVENITGESLFNAWKILLKSAYLRVNVIAPEEPENLKETVSEVLLKIKRDNIDDGKSSAPCRRRQTVKSVKERMDVAQGKLCMGFTAGESGDDSETAALTVMCDVFGGGPYSRLFTNVREKMSLCYYCSGTTVKQKSAIVVSSGVEAENAEKAKAEIINQLEAVGKNQFTDEELNSSKISILDTLKSYYDNQNAIDLWYGSKLYNKKVYTPDEVGEFISAVTREDVARVARNVTLNTVYTLLPKEAK